MKLGITARYALGAAFIFASLGTQAAPAPKVTVDKDGTVSEFVVFFGAGHMICQDWIGIDGRT